MFLDVAQVNRLEVIDENGRAFVRWGCYINVSVQDDGRTLKLFVNPASAPLAAEAHSE